MCRFVAYIGHKPILLKEILEVPENSLIKQSKQAKEGLHNINADGFGVAWYDQTIEASPGVFKSIQPAWNDRNLGHLAHKVKSNCFLGHVRSSTVGDVTLNNCHPFTFESYSFVHNGTIHHFYDTRRALMAKLDDVFFNGIRAQTDSEHLFALIMHFLHKDDHRSLVRAVQKAFAWVQQDQMSKTKEHFSYLNICLSNGTEMIATRYVTKGYDPFSLYYTTQHFDTPISESLPEGTADAKGYTVIASEPLTDYTTQWQEVPHNHYIYCDANHQMTIKPLSVDNFSQS